MSRSRRARLARLNIIQNAQDAVLIGIGVLLAALGLKAFLLPNGFLDGGVTGISLLANRLSGWSISVLIVVINTPFILLAYRQLSKTFTVKTIVAIVGLAAALALIKVPVITQDKLLIAIFGGFFLGAGIGMSIRGGAVLDGTEVLALYINRKTVLSIGEVIMYFNVLIFGVAAVLINVETALYAMLTYLSASKTVDFVIQGFEEYIALTVISPKSELIRKTLTLKLKKGVTVFKGKSGFGKRGEVDDDIDIVYTVVTRLEVHKIIDEIEKIDEKAFIVQTNINDTRGGMIKRRAAPH
ncbi:YitT family protein [Chitinophaga sp. GCM10012297]|uniref:YitT family protein n=1 Tax=Chitinophaga chungangae TaxID=2821488 RepID=A0ABS3YEV6_9BACT|nr:YitT family protein [Chitinophaga chungangae]MBO9152828.1 YitT family protein [Chitinophaga chungangae]